MRQYGTVESSDQLLATFYQLSQNKGEEFTNFHGTISRNFKQDPKKVSSLGTLR